MKYSFIKEEDYDRETFFSNENIMAWIFTLFPVFNIIVLCLKNLSVNFIYQYIFNNYKNMIIINMIFLLFSGTYFLNKNINYVMKDAIRVETSLIFKVVQIKEGFKNIPFKNWNEPASKSRLLYLDDGEGDISKLKLSKEEFALLKFDDNPRIIINGRLITVDGEGAIPMGDFILTNNIKSF